MKTRNRVLLGATAAKVAGSIGVAAWLFIGGALPFAASAQTRTWIGGGANALASTTANWVDGIAPSVGESVLFDDDHYGNAQTNVTWNLEFALESWNQTANFAGVVTLQTKYPGQGAFTNLNITGDVLLSGGKWTHLDNSSAEVNRLSVSVGGSLTVATGAVITADFLGYDGGKGPGLGTTARAGGGYGGSGGDANIYDNGTGGPCYGSVTDPTNCGSGGNGSATYSGGGAILITVAGTATLDGLISANGVGGPGAKNANWGCGSGGTIAITAGSFVGAGTLAVDGGSRTANYGAGGGGGRIAVVATSTPGFGTLAMQSGGGFNGQAGTRGGAGTVFTKEPGQALGTLAINNRGLNLCGAAIIPTGQTWEFDRINVISQGMLRVQAGTTLNLASNGVLANGTGDATGFIVNRGTFNTPADFVVTNCTLVADQMGTYPTLQHLTVAANAVMTHFDNSTAESYRIDLAIPGNFTLHSGGKVNVDFLGFDATKGHGYNGAWRTGGSHGGMGSAENAISGPTYGSIYCPTNLGSGGANGPGGGAVRLTVGSTARLDGTITAKGWRDNRDLGGGSGGSVCITAQKFEGSGLIEAEGAYYSVSRYNGGSGGGRVALIATETPGLDAIAVEGYGSDGAGFCIDGGAGTFYYQAPDEGPGMGTVKVKNVWANATPCTLPAMLNPVDNLKQSQWVLEDKGYLKMAANAQIRKMDIAATTAKLDLAGWTLTTTALVITNQVFRSGTYTAANIGSALVTDSVGTGQIVVTGISQTLIMIQ